MYADYNYYTTVYYGTVDESAFPRLATRASAYLDYFTMGKAKGSPEMDALKAACCALVDRYAEIEEVSAAARKNATAANSGGVKSESVGSYSVTYQTADEYRAMERELTAGLADIARMYLAGTDLLYRGGCRNVCTAHRNRL